MTDDADSINGWICHRCARKNPLDGDGRCGTPGCDGVHPVLRKQADEFAPDI